MEYKRLGDYIEPIDERNSKLEVKLSQGISNDKYFQEPRQVAENSAADKIVRKGYFAYNRATTRNGEKISIAYREGPDCTVSSAYQVFRIKDEEKLNPRYLWMWYKRPDFDRYARFRSHGSAHEFFEYEEMCNVMLPLPSIERQREIVEEYETLSRRICLNEQMIQNLEATAQTLYRKMFVDGIDKENLPDGWRMGTLGEVCDSFSKTHRFDKARLIFLNTSDIYEGKILLHDYSDVNKMPGQAKKEIVNGDILFSEIRPANKRYAIVKEKHPEDFVVSTKLMVLRMKDNSYSNLKLYFYLTLPEVLDDLQKQADGASGTFPQITFDGNLKNRAIIIGDTFTENKWEDFLSVYYKNVWEREQEISKLKELQSLLLAKMGNIKQ